MAGETENGSSNHSFGTCCEELNQVMSGEEFEPLITVGDDNILYMSVGLIDIDEDEPGMVDHPIFFCPFCGKEIQDADEVREKMDAMDDDS